MDSIDQIRNNIVEVDMLLDYASNNTEDIKRYQMFIKASVVLLSTKFEVFLEEFIDEHSRLVLAGHTNATISTELKNKYIAIVHGIGTGKLKKVTFDTLKNNKNVLEYKLCIFNEGMTIVKLKL